MSKQKPVGDVNLFEAENFIKSSKDSVQSKHNVELDELMDIVLELCWRYGGDKHVLFNFSTEKKTQYAVEISVIYDTVHWKDRIWFVDEVDPVLVMIDF